MGYMHLNNSIKMSPFFSLFLFLFFFAKLVFANDGIVINNSGEVQPISSYGSIKGLVLDKSTRLPLAGANIGIFKITEKTALNGTSADEEGLFEFNNTLPGKYYIRIDFIGFEQLKSRPFTIVREQKELDLGVFELKISPILSESIDVSAEKTTMVNSIDRKIYNVQKDIASQSGSAEDILQNIPSVSADVNGAITLRGAANVSVFINGRPSLLMRRNSAAALQQMPAAGIERIEVITNPSAKYKPDGVGGIINIVLKKETRRGLNGNVIANAGNLGRYNANAALNYHPGKLNLFGSVGLRRTNNPRISSDSRIQKDSLGQVSGYYNANSSSAVKPLAQLASLGLDYAFDDHNQFNISGDYFYQDSYHTQNGHTLFRDSSRQATTDFTSDRTNDEYENEWEVSSGYEHQFEQEDHTLQLELNYSGYDEKEDNHYNEIYTIPGISNALRHNLIRKGGSLVEFYTEYVLPLGEDSQLEAGYAGEFLRDDIRYLGQDYNGLQSRWITDYNKTNRFLFTQNIHALYATYEQSIEDFSFLAGLRAEQALITSNLVSADTTIPNHYFKFYPTLHLAYDLSEGQQLQLNYSHRVRRADSDEHNPFAEYTDPRNMEAGNPKIKPEQIHSVEFGWHFQNEKFSILPSIYYRYKYDAFTEIRSVVNDSVLLRYSTNLANDQSAGMELIVSADVKKMISLNFSANAFYYVIDASNLGYSSKKSTLSWNAKLAANFHLWEANLVQLNAYYRSARLTPQGETRPLILFNLGVRQRLFHNKAALTLTVSDVFNSLKWTRTIDTPVLYEKAVSKRNSQIIYLGFSYRFGTNGEHEKEKLEFDDKI